jgi:hypothetical protein
MKALCSYESKFKTTQSSENDDVWRPAAIRQLVILYAREFWELPKPYAIERWDLDGIEAAAITRDLPGILKGAPLASWFLARLQYLWQSVTGPDAVYTPVDDGGYSFEFLVVEGTSPVAEWRLTPNKSP